MNLLIARKEIKMKKTKTIAAKNNTPKLPTLLTAVTYLYLDKFNAPGWVWGVVGTIFAIFWIASIISFFISDSVDIFEEGN